MDIEVRNNILKVRKEQLPQSRMSCELCRYASTGLINNQRVNNVRPGARLPIIIAPIAIAVSLNRLLGLPPSAGFR